MPNAFFIYRLYNEFEGTWAIILKKLVASGSVNIVEKSIRPASSRA